MRPEKTGKTRVIASSQPIQDMGEFDYVRTVELGEEAAAKHEDDVSFYPPRKWDSPSWGMVIDLDLCIGCNACVVACQAENNMPVVGKEQVARGREMHWLRVDRYYTGEPTSRAAMFQPVPCMHCEKAPCEMGCPVNATVHSPDGLNLQVYNRCIGTRTCSSYCPYKVRRFNWFDYTGDDSPELSRGAQSRRHRARARRDGEVHLLHPAHRRRAHRRRERGPADPPTARSSTACQQACPTQAIVFGDITDPDSAVSRRKADGRALLLLEELDTRPRTTYLARWNDESGEGGRRMSQADAAHPSCRRARATPTSPTRSPASRCISRAGASGWIAASAVLGAARRCCSSSVTVLFIHGVGIWGINIPVDWGFAIPTTSGGSASATPAR